MDKIRFLDMLLTERAEWDQVLSRIDEVRMSVPGVAGEWSVKDVVAHVTWYEREMVGVLTAHALAGSDLWDLPTDERNQMLFEQNRQRPLGDVLAEARQVFDQLLAAMRSLSDEDLVDPGRFRDMPADWVPWQILAGNTYEHYRDHLPGLREWLEES
jgi:uncharacterized protein (TIGR03083 family)